MTKVKNPNTTIQIAEPSTSQAQIKAKTKNTATSGSGSRSSKGKDKKAVEFTYNITFAEPPAENATASGSRASTSVAGSRRPSSSISYGPPSRAGTSASVHSPPLPPNGPQYPNYQLTSPPLYSPQPPHMATPLSALGQHHSLPKVPRHVPSHHPLSAISLSNKSKFSSKSRKKKDEKEKKKKKQQQASAETQNKKEPEQEQE
ncbi:hypothetical protein H4219_003960 [Mycoemilia scoparia]|uniref:Uncharacterized protein n=1 Tax=Mycoemilia scoparia TaxID=417184 RepID=A0A9W7ZTM9_9FUNG|nr:hypothetical protein H4219_003960 [Mycoemilia scoparia]